MSGWINGHKIVRTACALYNLDRKSLLGPCRLAHLVRARHLVMLACSQKCAHLDMTRTGRILNRDRTTVRHGLQKAAERMRRDSGFRKEYESLLARLDTTA